jgi:hypothetical protein
VGRLLLIIILFMFVTAGLVSRRIGEAAKAQTENAVRTYQRSWGKNLAQAGVNMGLRKLAEDSTWRAGYGSAGSPIALYEGSVYVTLSDVTFFGRQVVKVAAIATIPSTGFGTRSDTSIAYVLKPTFSDATILGAITTNNDVNTLGSLNVDGRDHDTTMAGSSPNVIAATGKYGVWTTGEYDQGGTSRVGGTSTAAVDFAPSKPGDVSVIAEHQVYPGGFPGSPDSVMGGAAKGFPEGTLKTIAQSGLGGSQYVTDPAALTTPLKGVTYVELPSGGSWISPNITGSGIIVVHNAAKNAIIKAFSGKFTGVLISDDIDKIHAKIIGAVVSITPAPASGNTIGNGTGDIYFSRQAVSLATTSYLSTNQFGSKNAVLAWWE